MVGNGLDVITFVLVGFVVVGLAAGYAGWHTYEHTWGSKGDPAYRQRCIYCGGPTREPYHRWRGASICDDCIAKHKARRVTAMMTAEEARQYRGKTIPPSFLVDVEEDKETS
jgi:hypothetical protein